jgi:hypothetical protein
MALIVRTDECDGPVKPDDTWRLTENGRRITKAVLERDWIVVELEGFLDSVRHFRKYVERVTTDTTTEEHFKTQAVTLLGTAALAIEEATSYLKDW